MLSMRAGTLASFLNKKLGMCLQKSACFNTGWEMGRNRDQTSKFQAEIYVLVGVAWGEEQAYEAKIA